jgi:hypothetical protein
MQWWLVEEGSRENHSEFLDDDISELNIRWHNLGWWLSIRLIKAVLSMRDTEYGRSCIKDLYANFEWSKSDWEQIFTDAEKQEWYLFTDRAESAIQPHKDRLHHTRDHGE